MRQREGKRINRKTRNGRADRRKEGTIVDGGKMGRHNVNSSSGTIRMRERGGGSMTTFERFDFGGGLGEVRLKERAEGTPRSTFGPGHFEAERRLRELMLIVPIYLVNTRRRTPTTVTHVSMVRSSLQRRVPETFPVGGARRAGRDGLVKGGIDTIIELINKKINRRRG